MTATYAVPAMPRNRHTCCNSCPDGSAVRGYSEFSDAVDSISDELSNVVRFVSDRKKMTSEIVT